LLSLASAVEDLLEIIMRRYERGATTLTSNRPIEEWRKLFGDTPAVAAFLDRTMHHSHPIETRGKSYRLLEHGAAARNRTVKTSASLEPAFDDPARTRPLFELHVPYKTVATYGPAGPLDDPAGLNSPAGVTADANGKIYVANQNSLLVSERAEESDSKC
jgi:hypothetical protein